MHFSESELYMKQCFFLAKKGAGLVSPNPMVGAVLVYQNRIIGEGYHKAFGQAHAEVEAIDSVSAKDRTKIPDSVLFVSLEPCNHVGKTPPCTLRIQQEGIKTVYYACEDPNPQMSGKSIEWLRQQGIQTIGPVLSGEGADLIRAFRINVLENRPYVILKFAQSSDFFLARNGRTKISNVYSDMLVHRWRHEADGILIGKNTLITDHPNLTTRLWPGKNPQRFLLGNMASELKDRYAFFNADAPSYELKDLSESEHPELPCILQAIRQKNVGILLVEGGAKTIQSFLEEGLWDEARIITNNDLKLGGGIPAPSIRGYLEQEFILNSDVIRIVRKNRPS